MDEYELYLSGFSIPEVSNKTLIPKSTLRFRFKKRNILRSRGDGVRNAFKRGIIVSKKGTKRKPFSEEWKSNMSKSRLRWADKNARGYTIKKNGYIEMTRGGDVYKSLHRVVGKSLVGRDLKRREVIHHKDGNRQNNDISNLQMLTLSEHMRLHGLINIKTRKRDKKGRLL